MEDRFTKIYTKNIWGSSGSGSNYSPTNKWYLNELREHIDAYDIRTIADLGCGDWELMKHFIFNDREHYTGMDCVKYLIDNHNRDYNKPNVKFIHSDVSVEVPSGFDLVILKDVLQHWNDSDIMNKLTEILQKNKYVYVINGYKFMRVPEKNAWTKRELDKKYNYHPLSFDKEPFDVFKNYIIDCKSRHAKQYILMKM